MKKLLRPLALSAALGAGGILGTNLLLADEKPAKPTDPPPVKTLPADPVKPALPGLPGRAGNAAPMAESKADNDVAPVKVGDVVAKTEFALKPKDISAQVKKGLDYLVKAQQEDGGWNQGGGWRTGVNGGGRVEGAKVEDPSDIGNTCFVLLALLRAGNTVTDGEYKENVKKGLAFVIAKVEKADKDSLYVTDVRGTQLQSKIGPYVDTFLVNLVLAEFRGKSGDQEKKLIVALEKTMTKIVRHQTADGGFAGNGGWASTLSMGICNKGLARAKERGAVVDEVVLKRALAQSTSATTGAAPVAVAGLPAPGGSGAKPAAPVAGRAGDAGVGLYAQSQGAGNGQDILNSLRADEKKAKDVLADPKAPQRREGKGHQDAGRREEARRRQRQGAGRPRQAGEGRPVRGRVRQQRRRGVPQLHEHQRGAPPQGRQGLGGVGREDGQGAGEGPGQGRELAGAPLHHRQDVLHGRRAAGAAGRPHHVPGGRAEGRPREEGHQPEAGRAEAGEVSR